MQNKIHAQLLQMAEPEFCKFTQALSPDAANMLGIRIPALRAYAKEIAKTNPNAVFDNPSDEFMEDTLLRGMVICHMKGIFAQKLKLMREYVPQILCWSVCDIFCADAKFVKTDLAKTWDFVIPYLSSQKEYEVRFGAVMLLNYFILPDKVDETLQELQKVRHDGYYAKMAVAWAYSVCCAKFPDKTIEFLKTHKFDNFIYKKSIQKSIESFRVSSENKEILRGMRVAK